MICASDVAEALAVNMSTQMFATPVEWRMHFVKLVTQALESYALQREQQIWDKALHIARCLETTPGSPVKNAYSKEVTL